MMDSMNRRMLAIGAGGITAVALVGGVAMAQSSSPTPSASATPQPSATATPAQPGGGSQRPSDHAKGDCPNMDNGGSTSGAQTGTAPARFTPSQRQA